MEDSILFEGVDVGRHAKIRRAIIDKGVHIPAGIEIGYDHDLDRSRGFTVTDSGVTVIAKTHGVEHFSKSPSKACPVRRGWRMQRTKKGPRKSCVPGGQRTRHCSGSDWTLPDRRRPRFRTGRRVGRSSI